MSLNKLYNLTCEGKQFVSINPPKAVPDAYYSLVEISYDTTAIRTIKGIYIGKDDTEMSECVITDLNINDVVLSDIEGTYIDKLKYYIETFEDEDKINVIRDVDIIDFNSEEPNEILIKLFLTELGSVLTYYHFMSVEQHTIGYPFHPIQFNFPLPSIDLSVLDQNLAEYLSYPAQILLNICTKNHGKLWMGQIIDFWNVWGVLFPKKLDLKMSTNDIIYDSVVGYANHLYNQTATMCKYFKSAENVITDGCNHIQKATEESLKIVKNTNLGFQKKFRYASLLITTIATTVLKTIKLECDYSLNEMIECKEKCVKDIQKLNREISNGCNKCINDIERMRSDAHEEIRKSAHECIDNVETKIRYIDQVSDEVQKHLKIYSKQCIEGMNTGKHQVIRHLWDCVPEIVEKVRRDVGKIINKNVSRRIECKFSDVMVDYKKNAENRLAEVLNPVVVQKVELFREEADRSIARAKNHADRAREHANRASDLVTRINNMETRINNMETEMSETAIQSQINELRTDMEEMKDVVNKIARALNIRR